MAIEKSEKSTSLMKNTILVSIRTSYKLIHDYPYPFYVCIFLFVLYKILPSLFFLILHSSPVIAVTSLLLAALLAYGERETKSHERCSENNNSQINTEFKSRQSSSAGDRESNSHEISYENNNSQIHTEFKSSKFLLDGERETNSHKSSSGKPILRTVQRNQIKTEFKSRQFLSDGERQTNSHERSSANNNSQINTEFKFNQSVSDGKREIRSCEICSEENNSQINTEIKLSQSLSDGEKETKSRENGSDNNNPQINTEFKSSQSSSDGERETKSCEISLENNIPQISNEFKSRQSSSDGKRETFSNKISSENNNSQINTEVKSSQSLSDGKREINSHERSSENNNSQINTEFKSSQSLSDGERETNSHERTSENNNSQINTEFKSSQSSSDSDSNEKSENHLLEKKNSEKERFQRLTSLIERRRARMSLRHSIKRNLIEPDGETSIDDFSDFEAKVSPVNIPRWDPFADQDEDFELVPGSAPSVLHERRAPFEDVLPGTTRFSGRDPFLITEMVKRNHTNTPHVHDVQIKNGQKELDLKNIWSIRSGYDFDAMVGNFDMAEIHGHKSGNSRLNAEISQLECKVLFPTELEKDVVSKAELTVSEEGDTINSYSDTLLLSEYLNLCSLGISRPTKEPSPHDTTIKPREEKVNNAPYDTCNGVSDTSALGLETVKIEESSENDLNLEPKEKVKNRASDTRALGLETVKIEENGESDENLEPEEEASSVIEVKSILKQLREEIVKAEPILDGVLELKHEANGSVSNATSGMVLSEPLVVEESVSVVCETGDAPDSLLRRSPLSSSIANNLKKLRKQNKHGESSSSSLSDSD